MNKTFSLARFSSIFRLAVLGVALLASAACATGSFFHPAPVNEKEANIYVYRPQWPVGAWKEVSVSVGDQNVGSLHSGAYLVTHVAPGDVVVSGKTSNAHQVVIKAEAGRSYYVRVDTVTDVEVLAGPWIQEVSEHRGLDEISDLRFSK